MATSELQRLLEEECRVVLNNPADLIAFEAVVQDAEQRWQAAFGDYRRHVEEHSCTVKVRSASGLGHEY